MSATAAQCKSSTKWSDNKRLNFQDHVWAMKLSERYFLLYGSYNNKQRHTIYLTTVHTG